METTDFFSQANEDACTICLRKDDEIVNPIQTECGHQFCELCITMNISVGRIECPNCRHLIKRISSVETLAGQKLFSVKFDKTLYADLSLARRETVHGRCAKMFNIPVKKLKIVYKGKTLSPEKVAEICDSDIDNPVFLVIGSKAELVHEKFLSPSRRLTFSNFAKNFTSVGGFVGLIWGILSVLLMFFKSIFSPPKDLVGPQQQEEEEERRANIARLNDYNNQANHTLPMGG